ncbi:hypothetical protein BLS_001408 [Venturia inaequalis]|uniref:Uncharacterized protein n=1 Tax=Venturia inaequalis TaxID=5025 RepID=A0A8H3U206_VENIN|nr:hypothetical protein BLS_001408 [Venturia inaequalis]
MFSIKSLFVVVVGLSTLTLAAPIETAPTNTTAIADGCKDAYRGEHGACEDARDQKHAGEREEHRGEREIHNGNEIGADTFETVQLVEHIYLEDGFAGGGGEAGALQAEGFGEGEGEGDEAVAVVAGYV